MFVLSNRASSASQVIATLLAIALVMWAIGFNHFAQAANLTFVSNTLTDSDPSAFSGHFIEFTIPAASSLGAGDDIVITFPTGFASVTDLVSGDLVVRVDGGAAETIGNFDSTGQVVTFDGVVAVAGETISVEVAEGIVINPAVIASYEFIITTPVDRGETQVAIVDNVLVTANVATQFTFTIGGMATGTSVNSEASTITGSTTTIPFGTLVAGVPQAIAQRLTVTTNADRGFVVTVEQDQNLLSSNGSDIDAFEMGSYENTPSPWSAPIPSISDENTWGHWGLTTNDANLTGGAFAANDFVAASTTPRLIFDHDGPSDGLTQNAGLVDVLYKIQITALQEAADDYNTTLTYIATPTF